MRLAALVLVLATAANARADDAGSIQRDAELAEAKRLEAALEYEPALVIVERVIARGGATREALVELHLMAGKLAAGLDRAQIAQEHFARVLALAPATTLPDGTSPKLTTPFDEARTRTVALRVVARSDRGAVALIPQADPLQLVAGIAVKLHDGRVLHEPRAHRIVLPPNTRAVEVSAFDEHGNTLWNGTLVATTTIRPVTGQPPPNSPSLYRRWGLWAGISAVALTAGGVAAWRFDVAQDQWNDLKETGTGDFTELRAIESRGRRWGLAANISFGVAAAAGIGAFVAYLTRADEPRVVVDVLPDAYGLAVAGGF